MAMRGRNAMGGRNPGRSKSIEDALRQVLAGGGRGSSPRPKLRPQARPNATSPRPQLRPETIGGMEGGSTRGVSPMDNYSKEDLMRLIGSVASGGAGAAGRAAMTAGRAAAGFKQGGAVRKKKPKNGCVMQGRGGSYKGQK